MRLTYEQKRSMLTDGFIHVKGAVPKLMVDDAMRAINYSIGEGIPPDDLPILRARSFCPELKESPVILDMYNKTPVKTLVEDLIGEGMAQPMTWAQIALRFPSYQDPPIMGKPHLDGASNGLNGVPAGAFYNFTMLVGVLLNPVREPYAGNFTVWPGSHTLFEQYSRNQGTEAFPKGLPDIDLPEPVQTMGEPGDLFLVHQMLAHKGAPNVSPLTRYAVYFRVFHRDHDQKNDWQTPTKDIWLHWPGIRAIQ
jgi:hypothetical protein